MFAMSVAGILYISMSLRFGFFSTIEELINSLPPGRTVFSNLSSEGALSAITASASVTTGEPTGSLDTMTLQFAVPPRISGPYDGIHETCLSSIIPAYVTSCPSSSTPCPPKPALINLLIIPVPPCILQAEIQVSCFLSATALIPQVSFPSLSGSCSAFRP